MKSRIKNTSWNISGKKKPRFKYEPMVLGFPLSIEEQYRIFISCKRAEEFMANYGHGRQPYYFTSNCKDTKQEATDGQHNNPEL